MSDLDQLAAATYRAMLEFPGFVHLAQQLVAATSSTERAAILDGADPAAVNDAIAYLAAGASAERERRLAWLRADPRRLEAVRSYYRTHLVDFIGDWGMTHDPRLADKVIRFSLFERQKAMIAAMVESYFNKEPLSIVKSRDSGASWCAMALLVSLALFEDGFTAIVGSQLEIKIDQSGTTGTLFHKVRMFLEYLPVEFRGGWTLQNGSANMRVWFPNGSAIQGQAGEQIGRGNRASVACLDEYAWIEHPDTVDQALMATSDCKWYISTPHGSDNPFAERVREGKTKVFVYRWQDDPRKSPEWAAKEIDGTSQKKFDQEYGCSFNVGSEDQMFPQAHLDALLDAHVKLKIEPIGRKFGGFDPGGGGDPSAFVITEGPVVTHIESWASTPNLKRELRHAFGICDKHGLSEFNADCCGIGNGLEHIAKELNDERVSNRQKPITMHAFKASEAPLAPEQPSLPGSSAKAKDAYPNKKSQAYDLDRFRASVTFQMLQGESGNPEYVLSIDSRTAVDQRNKLLLELAQITCSETPGGKLAVDKYGSSGASPNLADAFALATAPRRRPLRIRDSVFDDESMPGELAISRMRFNLFGS